MSRDSFGCRHFGGSTTSKDVLARDVVNHPIVFKQPYNKECSGRKFQ